MENDLIRKESLQVLSSKEEKAHKSHDHESDHSEKTVFTKFQKKRATLIKVALFVYQNWKRRAYTKSYLSFTSLFT